MSEDITRLGVDCKSIVPIGVGSYPVEGLGEGHFLSYLSNNSSIRQVRLLCYPPLILGYKYSPLRVRAVILWVLIRLQNHGVFSSELCIHFLDTTCKLTF